MPTSTEALAVAIDHHRAGRLQLAEQIYRQVLADDPNQFDAWNLLGVIASQVGKHPLAADYLGRAIQISPNVASAHGNLGLVQQTMGQLADAIASYRRALDLEPHYVEALHNLGNALRQQGELAEAVTCYRRALEVRPGWPDTELALGTAWKELGKLDQAIACFQSAVRGKPDSAPAWQSLASALRAQGKRLDAAACYQRLQAIQPDSVAAHHGLGSVLRELGQLEGASGSLRRAIALSPRNPDVHQELGVTLLAKKEFGEALECFQRACELKPDFADAFNNQGLAWRELGELDRAVACFERALELRPDFAEVYNNLGLTRKECGRLDDAAACYQRAVTLRPHFALAHNNLGNLFKVQRKVEEAGAAYQRALEIDPDYVDAHVGHATLRLLAGDFAGGLPEYEWRWRRKDFTPATFTQPRWDGAPLHGKTILFYSEQGLGDTLQFVRYAAAAREFGGRVILQCQKPLLPILSRCPYLDAVIDQLSPDIAFDVHAPLLSLPCILGTTPKTIPSVVPYIWPDPQLADAWREKLSARPGLSGFRIGVVWQGNRDYRGDRSRSVPLKSFERLAGQPGVSLVSLQKGAGEDQLGEARGCFDVVDLGPLDDAAGAFMDTAAVMCHLDLVISVDTASAHLAGALGVPTWLLLSFASDWRWGLEGNATPWYPTMRIFREPEMGDRTSIMRELLRALREELEPSSRGATRD